MKRRMVTIISFMVLFLLLVSAVSAAPGKGKGRVDPPGQLVDLQLLAFNDYHGHLEANTPGTDRWRSRRWFRVPLRQALRAASGQQVQPDRRRG